MRLIAIIVFAICVIGLSAFVMAAGIQHNSLLGVVVGFCVIPVSCRPLLDRLIAWEQAHYKSASAKV